MAAMRQNELCTPLRLGYASQPHNLIAPLMALENVALPQIFSSASPRAAEKPATMRLEPAGPGHRLHHRPAELSGGQQQSAAIARALVTDPTIILADEPTPNLDLHTGAESHQFLKRSITEEGVSIVTATHDHKMLQFSNRVIHIRDRAAKRVQAQGALRIEKGTSQVGGTAVE